jgi:hypothetical protein
MYTSSPGGIALQDYHWSGGFYSPNFLSYDKWGQSLPHDLYGFNGTVSEMIPKRNYENKLQQFPIPIRNYELLDTMFPPIETKNEEVQPQQLQLQPRPIERIETKSLPLLPLYEKFTPSGNEKTVLIIVLTAFLIYLFDKTFDSHIRGMNLWLKLISLVFIGLIIYLLQR